MAPAAGRQNHRATFEGMSGEHVQVLLNFTCTDQRYSTLLHTLLDTCCTAYDRDSQHACLLQAL